VQETLRRLEFVAEVKLRKDRDFEELEERKGFEITSQNQAQEERRQSIGPRVFEESNRWLKFSEGESPKFHGPLDPVDKRMIKVECLTTLTSSGGRIAIRSESMRVIDLCLNFVISEFRGVEKVVTRKKES
jgi:hypothetical protein